MADRAGAYWAHAVSAAGALLVVLALVRGAPASNPFRILLGIGPGVVLLAGGVRLARGALDADLRRRVAGWTAVGAVALLAVYALFQLEDLASGQAVTVSAFTVRVAAGVGAIGGIGVGVQEAKSVYNAREQERERTRREVVEREREALLFLNNVLRHHVLNGMQIIRGNAETLADADDPATRERAETIVERSESVVDLVQNVRSLVRATSETLDPEPTDLGAVLADAAASVRDAHPDAVIEVERADATVLAGPLLTAVFENLLRNGVEHNDGDRPRVTASVSPGPDTATVRVADDGPGIPEERRETLFEPADHGDQGLGLYLVDTLVERYGGSVAVTENDPRGTVVTVELPRVGSEADIEGPPAAAADD